MCPRRRQTLRAQTKPHRAHKTNEFSTPKMSSNLFAPLPRRPLNRPPAAGRRPGEWRSNGRRREPAANANERAKFKFKHDATHDILYICAPCTLRASARRTCRPLFADTVAGAGTGAVAPIQSISKRHRYYQCRTLILMSVGRRQRRAAFDLIRETSFDRLN